MAEPSMPALPLPAPSAAPSPTYTRHDALMLNFLNPVYWVFLALVLYTIGLSIYRHHARQSLLPITYKAASPEELISHGGKKRAPSQGLFKALGAIIVRAASAIWWCLRACVGRSLRYIKMGRVRTRPREVADLTAEELYNSGQAWAEE
ncbi:hypothetical protein P170DRAFT_479327 [Aspergillus steynii IBT 23096]|uniref:Uncharacterized protein n=1 Tax=Aspergillus steynii IBT 23096 TaxID=1392250 RepID=A0A2I2FVW1_9EURO|nr:uncharacterized protein P170DRAFT_479327 [Aspergillus steynii IBT 23096]PLB44779.1 hypothetical protein P170DRAFT_479327 [Aspergillus steynii IBT 23096]